MGGGSDNTYQNNIFIEGKIGVHIDNRLETLASWIIKSGELFEKRLQAVSYSKPPYTTQYPELKTYWDNAAAPSNNLFENNVFYNINKTIDGKKEWLDFKDTNWETKEDPGFVDILKENFELKTDALLFKQIKEFKNIPFEKIGPCFDKKNKLQ